ncbi:uncharacterized protein [Procambarus clarkii]|uniref:uncharacterized protein n=1 Tax=Procambarus clarkii TaxID=6728 RepID=UPI00374482FC
MTYKRKIHKIRAANLALARRLYQQRKAALAQVRVISSEDCGGLPVSVVRGLTLTTPSSTTLTHPPGPQPLSPRRNTVLSTSTSEDDEAVPSTSAEDDGAVPSTVEDDGAVPSTSTAEVDEAVATPRVSKRRIDTPSSAQKRLKIFREQTAETCISDNEIEGIKRQADARETVLMVTDRNLEKYLDENSPCMYCARDSQIHEVLIEQHNVHVIKTCNECNMSVKRPLQTNYDILKTLVHCNMLNGQGYVFYERWCAINRMKFVSQKVYDRWQDHIRDAANLKWADVQENTQGIIFDHYIKQLHREPTDGILDIDVSFDGSWHTRGHHSQIGTSFVVEIFTGMVVDFNVFCKKCSQCQQFERSKKSGKLNQAQFDSEMAKHLPKCDRNYSSSAKNMEADAAVLMWGRSDVNKLRYTTFVGDGDSSAYNKVCAMNNGAGPYGDTKVEKAERINHFSKRVSTQPRNLQKSAVEVKESKRKSRRMSLVKGKGKLTDSDSNSEKLTQNPNESLHQRVWTMAPKDRFVGRTMVDFAMAVTATNYNSGYSRGSLTSLIGIPQNDITDWYFSRKEKLMQKPMTRTTKPRQAPEEGDPGAGSC